MNFLKISLICGLFMVVCVSGMNCCYATKRKTHKKSGTKHPTCGQVILNTSKMAKCIENGDPVVVFNDTKDIEEFIKLIKAKKDHVNLKLFIHHNVLSCDVNLFKSFINILKTDKKIDMVSIQSYGKLGIKPEFKVNYEALTKTMKECSHIKEFFVSGLRDVVHDGLQRLSFESTSEDYPDEIMFSLLKNKSIEELNFYGDKEMLSEKLIDLFSGALYNINTLTKLNISGYTITKDHLLRFADALKKNKTVKILAFNQCLLDDESARVLADVLKYNTTIDTLDLSFNNITPKGKKMLEESFKERGKDVELELFNNLVASEEDFKHVQDMIETREIVFDGSIYPDENIMEFLINSAKEGKIDRVVFLDECGALELDFLIEFANQNLNIKEVAINDNNSIKYICDLIMKNTHVEILDLSYASLQNLDVSILVEALKKNKSISELDLSRNCIGEGGAKKLIELLKENKTLCTIDLFDNEVFEENGQNVTETSMRQISKILMLNKLRKEIPPVESLKDEKLYLYVDTIISLKDDICLLKFGNLNYDVQNKQLEQIMGKVKQLEDLKVMFLKESSEMFRAYMYYKSKLKFLSKQYCSKCVEKKYIDKIYIDTLDEIEAFKSKNKRFSDTVKTIKVGLNDIENLLVDLNDISTFKGYFNLFGNIKSLISYCYNEIFICDYTNFETSMKIDKVDLIAEDMHIIENKRKEWELQIDRERYIDLFNTYDEEMRKHKFEGLFKDLSNVKSLKDLTFNRKNQYIWVNYVFRPVFEYLYANKDFYNSKIKKQLSYYDEKMKKFFEVYEKWGWSDADQLRIYLKQAEIVYRFSNSMEKSKNFAVYYKFLSCWGKRENELAQNPELKLNMMIYNLSLYDAYVKTLKEEHPDLKEQCEIVEKNIFVSLKLLYICKSKSKDELATCKMLTTEVTRQSIKELLDTCTAKLEEQGRIAQKRDEQDDTANAAVVVDSKERTSADEDGTKTADIDTSKGRCSKKSSRKKKSRMNENSANETCTQKVSNADGLLKKAYDKFDLLQERIEKYKTEFESLVQKHTGYSCREYVRINKSGQAEEFAKKGEIRAKVEKLRELFEDAQISKDDNLDIMQSNLLFLECFENQLRTNLEDLEGLLLTAENFMEKKLMLEKMRNTSSSKIEEREEKGKKPVSRGLGIDSVVVCFSDEKVKLAYDFYITKERERKYLEKLVSWLQSETVKDIEMITSAKIPYISCRYRDSGRICFRLDEDFQTNHIIHIIGVEDNHDYERVNRKMDGQARSKNS